MAALAPTHARLFWLATLVMAVLAGVPLALIVGDPPAVLVAWLLVMVVYAGLIRTFGRPFAMEAVVFTTMLAVVAGLSMNAYRAAHAKRARAAQASVRH